MKIRSISYVLLFSWFLFLTGCSFNVKVNPDTKNVNQDTGLHEDEKKEEKDAGTSSVIINPVPKITVSSKYNLKAGIYIEETQLRQEYRQGGYCLVGLAHTWNVPVGEALRISALNSFRQIFTEVNYITSIDNSGNNAVNIIIKPSVREFKISQTINTRFILHAVITDGKNRIIYDKEFIGDTKGMGPFVTAFCCGVFMAPSAFSSSVNSAFEDAFEKLFYDIQKTVDFNQVAGAK